MTALYFVIAVLALIGAGYLLWLDRRRNTGARSPRALWGDKHSFRYRATDPKLRNQFHRAAMDVPEHMTVHDVAYGSYFGEEAAVFDLGDEYTIAAIRRTTGSDVVIDLREESALAPAETDVELLGAMGRRVIFTSHLDIARRVCDRRMAALAADAPGYLEVMWNEGSWTLGAMHQTTDTERLDTALETVRKLTDLLRVLPPPVDPQPSPDPRDPSAPVGRRQGMAEQRTGDLKTDRPRTSTPPVGQPPRPTGPADGPRATGPRVEPPRPGGPRFDAPRPAARPDTPPIMDSGQQGQPGLGRSRAEDFRVDRAAEFREAGYRETGYRTGESRDPDFGRSSFPEDDDQ